MAIYIVLLVFMIIFWGLSQMYKRYSNLLLNIMGIMMFVIAAFRSITVGIDTNSYVALFNSIGNKNFVFAFINGAVEAGYALYCQILYAIYPNNQTIIFANSLIIVFLFIRFIKKECKDKWLSLFLFLTLLYYFYTFDMARQYIAIGIVLNNLHLIRERKIWKYFSVIVLASSFHSSAMVYMVFYFLYKVDLTYIKLGISTIICISIVVLFDFVQKIIVDYKLIYYHYFIRDDKITALGGRSFLVVFLMFLFCVFYYGNVRKKHKDAEIYCIATEFACLFYYLSTKLYMFWRLGLCFSIFFIIFIPQVLSGIKNERDKGVWYFLVIIFCIFYYVYALSHNLVQGVVPYKLCFE